MTDKLVDKVSDGLDTTKTTTSKATESTVILASESYDSVKEQGAKAIELIKLKKIIT